MMCAISGVIGCELKNDIAEHMLKTMKRRGPDGRGIYHEKDCTLLHSRLAIVDLAGGAQPMQLNFGGENFAITYNGELYNTHELRKELIDLGHAFVGHSDTEVLLHAYVEWKEAALDKLNGIYAFAVWHSKEKQLFIARDRMGVKPLFYSRMGNVLIFASEIKTILASGLVSTKVDREGILQLVMLGPGRRQGSGVFKDIMELKPGYYCVYKNEKLSVRQYWRMKDNIHQESFEETAEHVRFLVRDSIQRQMVSDVPIGTFLSGGLDSSLITAVCAESTEGKLPTFSVDYENNDINFVPGKFQPDSDNEYIKIMNQLYKTDHSYSVLTPEDLVNALEEATIARDLPGMADVDFSLLAFCKDIRSVVKVALSGECADEIFGGYPWYRDPQIRDKVGFPWAQNTKYRASFLPFSKEEGVDFVDQCYLETIQESDILPENTKENRRIKEMVNLNVNWFMQTLLDRKDRMSMYNGLEVRVPFCDHRIAEYLYGVPWEFKDYKSREKGLLRYAMEGILPEMVLYRKKSPYPKTFDPRYEQIVSARLRDIILSPGNLLFEILRKDAVLGVLNAEMHWPWYGQLMRRPQTIAFLLQLDFWIRKYHVDFV